MALMGLIKTDISARTVPLNPPPDGFLPSASALPPHPFSFFPGRAALLWGTSPPGTSVFSPENLRHVLHFFQGRLFSLARSISYSPPPLEISVDAFFFFLLPVHSWPSRIASFSSSRVFSSSSAPPPLSLTLQAQCQAEAEKVAPEGRRHSVALASTRDPAFNSLLSWPDPPPPSLIARSIRRFVDEGRRVLQVRRLA